jgi:hypothetical protein
MINHHIHIHDPTLIVALVFLALWIAYLHGRHVGITDGMKLEVRRVMVSSGGTLFKPS